MSAFTFFKRGECPICNGLRNDCRRSNTTGLVFCRETSTTPRGHIYRGNDSHGFGMWQASTDFDAFTQQSQEERKRGRQEYLAARERRRQQQIQEQLSATERDTHYRAILQQLRLTDGDYQQLLERGFTPEQIKQDGYRSVSRWQEVGKNYPSNLPGLLNNGFKNGSINVFSSGILCPIRNEDGLIVGCQVRLNKEVENGRYRWLTSATKKNPKGATPHLNGELPITVLEPEEYEGDSIWVAEGTAFKPSLLRYRLNVPVLGAASGRFNTSPETTSKAVEYLSNKYKTKILTFAIDSGDVANKDGVPQRWLQQFDYFSKLGYEIRIAWWGQSTKTFPDIDELESFSNITYLSIKQFKELCVKWGGIKDNPANNISPVDYQERVAYEQKKLHSLTYSADYICDSSQKYLPDLIGKIPLSGIVSLKSPKGSGKSTQIKKIKNHCCGYTEEIEIKPEIEPEQLSLLDKNQKLKPEPKPETKTIRHKGLGMNFVSINARIALGRAQAVQWEFTWIEDADIDSKDEFGSKVSTASAIENISEIGCCWDSLGKFFERDWSNTLVVIDEIELGLNHLSTSSTCKDRRSFILKTLEVKLKECLDNGGLVVVADADFTDVSYDYLKAITGYTPYIVQHNYLGNPWDIEFYTGKRDKLLTQIEDWVSNENCEPIAIALDNQKECEALANYLIKKYPYLKNKFGGLIRIDSKITQTDFGKDFVKHTVKKIEEYKPKILMFTPSLGVGCDINNKYFKHVFGLFYGNLEPSQARQMLARERESVPRSVWCKARASNSQDTPTSYLPSEIKKRLFSNQKSTTEFIELALELARERAKAETGDSNPDDKELLPFLQEQLQNMMGDGGWDNPHVDLYCKQIARRNYSLNQLAVQLRQELIDEGHKLTDVAIDEATNTGDSVRHEKDEIKHQKA
ncbi:MAG: plasmid replication protein, CyRepA1 family, partial [Cyanobacteria bacterium J06649_11]